MTAMNDRMKNSGNYRVHVQQPTVPHYRVPFFDALSHLYDDRLVVSASRTMFDGPASAPVERDYLDLTHRCSAMLGGRIFWQHGLQLADGMDEGDVAVISANPRYLSTFKFAANARRRGMGLVWWGHGWSPTSRAWAMRVRSQLMSTVDAILLYSDAEVAEWRSRMPPSIAVIGAQNAIDQSQSKEQGTYWTAEKLLRFRNEQQLTGRKVLLFCGRLRTQPHTGADLLLKALAELLKSDAAYLAVIIGDGNDQQRLHSLAQALGIDSHVRWLGARYDETEIAPWFLCALCFVYPGPIGLSILHAMGYGLPVITHANRRRHNPEIVVLRDEWNGLMFEDGNVTDLAAKIAMLAADGELHQRLAANALATAHQDYTLDVMVRRFAA
ncbi:MAG: glycosyltransferase family 4 protein, partial [Steroidobacter sp.]